MLKNRKKIISEEKSRSRSKTSLSSTTTGNSAIITDRKSKKDLTNSSSISSDSDDFSSKNKQQNSKDSEHDSKDKSAINSKEMTKNKCKKDRDISSQPKESLENLIQKSIKKKEKKTKRSSHNNKFCLVITPISTSALKFSKKIRKPQIRITVYDAVTGKLLNKTNEKDDNKKLQHENYFLSEYGKIVNFNIFSFFWNSKNSTVIIDKETNYMQNSNIIIFFELIDNSNAVKSIQKSYRIAWCYYKPANSEIIFNLKNEIISLQLYYFQKTFHKSSSSNNSAYDEWTKRKRSEYPGVLNIKFNCQIFHPVQAENNSSRKNSYQNIFQQINKLSIENTNEINFENNSINLNYISKLNESHAFKTPEKIIFKSNFINNSKGSSACAFNINCDLVAFTMLYNRKPSDIIIVDLLSMQIKHILKGHEGFIHYLEWSNRKFDEIGEILLSCSEDETCILWQILEKSYEILHVLFHPTFVYCGTFLIENFTTLGGIITGGRDQLLRIWRTEHENSLVLVQELDHHKDFIIGVIYVFQSNKLFSADRSGIVIEWKLSNSDKFKWLLRKIIPYNCNFKQFLQHSILNRMYILSDNFMSALEIRSGIQQIFLSFSCTKDSPNRLAVSKCGKYIFMSFKSKIICWDIKLKIIVKEYFFNEGYISWIAFNPEKNIMAISLLNNCSSSCILYSTLDYFTIENVTKNYINSKSTIRLGMSVNNYYNYILQKLDQIFDLENNNDNCDDVVNNVIKTRENFFHTKNQTSIIGNVRNEESVDENESTPNTEEHISFNNNNQLKYEKETDLNDRTFSIENSHKTFTLSKKTGGTGTFNVITIKENKIVTKLRRTFTIEQSNDDDTDATDVSESLDSDK